MKALIAVIIGVLALSSCSPAYTGRFMSNPDITLLGRDDSDFPDVNSALIYRVNGSATNPLLAKQEDGQLKLGRNEVIILFSYKQGQTPIYQAFIPVVVNFVSNTVYYARATANYPYANGWIEDHNGKKVTGIVQVPLTVQQPNGARASVLAQNPNPQYNSLQMNALQPYQFQTVPAATATQPVVLQPVVKPFDIGITPTGKLQ